MKKFTTLAILLLLCMVGLFAQAPEKFTYQAVVRFANNSLAANTQIGVRISILQGSVVGEAVFVETHIVNSNTNGLITLEIGSGNVQVGSISNIAWSNGLFFLKTETDPYGGIDYIVTSTQQLMSVPYALYAKEAGNGFSGDYNDLTNTPVIPIVPTNVSAFTNDAGYLTSFTEQQVLNISNDTIFLTGGSFVKLPAATSSFSGDYNDLINKPEIPTIPTDVSVFNNDANYVTVNQLNAANYITAADVPVQVNADWDATSGVAQILNKPELFDGDYNSLTNTPSIPTTVSELANDANFITINDIPEMPTIPSNVSAFTNDAGYLTSFTEQQVLTISNDTIFLTGGSFVKLPEGFDGDYNSLTNTPEIPDVPANVSAFNNDVGYIVNNNPACSNTVNLCELQNKINELDSLLHLINELPSTPTVLTTGITAISTTSFTINGEVVMAGGSTVSERGFVYGLTSNPTIYNSKKNCGSGLGTYTATISGLQAGHIYYVRAFATNTNGTAYGSQMTVTTNTQAPSTLPIVNTVAVVNITSNEATVSANVMSDGGETVTQRGFVYDTLPNSTTSNNVAYHGTGTGHYSNLLTDLLSGKTYYVRAFATNSVGTAYGNEISFATSVPSPVAGDAIPCPNTPTVTDHEGNVYNTVKIGTQCWTKENMRATTSPSTGTYLIPPAGTTHTCSGKQARWYNDDSTTYAPRNYGLLYNWNAAVDTFDVEYGEISMNGNNGFGAFINGNRRGICPEGWHVPSSTEWDQLAEYLNNHAEYRSGDVYGYAAKSLASTIDWNACGTPYTIGNDLAANNAAGFNALPAGKYNRDDYYHTVGTHAWFWSTNYSANGAHAHSCRLENNRPEMFVDHAYALNLCSCASVRCLRDIPCTEPVDTTGGGTTPVDTTTAPADTTTSATHGIPCPGTPTVTDIDGNTYNTVQIGQQCWMKENLRTTHYENGDEIVNGGHSWMSYDDPLGYFIGPSDLIYGYYYNGKAAIDPRNICPQGWHVPSDAEWTQLTDYIRSQSNFLCLGNSNHIAKAMAYTSGWNESENICVPGNNQEENNSSGFSAFPAGRVYAGYGDIGNLANFWTSTTYETGGGDRVISRSIGFYYPDVESDNWYDYSAYKIDGKSVRCVKD